jgi:hypothetical protein
MRGVEVGVETEVRETLEPEAIMKEGVDEPSPMRGVYLNEGGFQNKIDEVDVMG